MSKSSALPARPIITATEYSMKCIDTDGVTRFIPITGEETFRTQCPVCGKAHSISFNVFIDIAHSDGLHGVSVYCPKCSIRQQANKA